MTSAEDWFDENHENLQSANLNKLRRKLEIDKHRLDFDVQEQPVLFDEVSDKTALAVSVRDEVKENLDRMFAEKAAHYRKIRAKGEGRVTDKIINDDVTQDKQYVRMVKKFNVCRNMANRWMALKSAFEQRASMLKVMAQLYSSNYFSVSSVGGDQSHDVKQAAAAISRRRIHAKRTKV